MIHVANLKGLALIVNNNLVGAQCATVLFAKHGNKNFVLEFYLSRVPVDIEPAGIPARRTILEDVPPISIFRPSGHVVGDDIEDLAHAERPQRVENCA